MLTEPDRFATPGVAPGLVATYGVAIGAVANGGVAVGPVGGAAVGAAGWGGVGCGGDALNVAAAGWVATGFVATGFVATGFVAPPLVARASGAAVRGRCGRTVSGGGLPVVGEGAGGEPPAVGVVTIGLALVGVDPPGEGSDEVLAPGVALAGAGAAGILRRPARAVPLVGQEDVGGATARVLGARTVPLPCGIDAPNWVLETIEPALT